MPTKNPIHFFIILLTTFANVYDSHAFSPGINNCTYHFSEDTTSDPHVSHLLSIVGRDGAVRYCPAIDENEEDWYYILAPISHRDRVYFYVRTQVFLVKNAEATEWEYYPPEHLRERLGDRYIRGTFMCAEGFSCERHNSEGFVPTKGLSPHLFLRLQESWTNATKSEAAFYDLAKETFYDDEAEAKAFNSAVNFIFKQSEILPRILSVRFEGSELFRNPENGNIVTVPSHFEFTFGDVRRKIWSMHYEYDDDGIKFLFLTESAP